ncbi:MAG: phosphoenolpyruvate--protein phosphotransferase [Verrucomicrobiales bacterium]|jgi:phosphotransferase system enzyme I (PtsI)|nr:phosphoenolpyruvate--protein phosphotransferase [Verrucomicrobiales bacterium]
MADSNTTTEEFRLSGIPVSPGVVHGPLEVLTSEELLVPKNKIAPGSWPEEIARLEAALVKTRREVIAIKEHLSASIGEKDASIFDAHLLVLEDSSLIDAVRKQIEQRNLCVEIVFHHLIQNYAQSMRQMDDAYLRERASDILDVGRRVLSNLLGANPSDKYNLEKPSIILAHDLSPSDTAMLDRSKVLGFVTDIGSRTSHTAIMARSLNIPAVVGLKDASHKLGRGLEVILDGHEGLLIVNPSAQTKFEYGQLEHKRHQVDAQLESLRGTEAITKDGRKVILSANVELPEDFPLIRQSGAEGVGLYRTEFLFLNRLELPTEQEQIEIYRRVIESSSPHPVIFRTLDIGGDKMLDHLGSIEEMNPFLGWRAIRYTLERQDIFRTQLRAICRAGEGVKVRIMFPMICTFEELQQSKQVLAEVLEELQREGVGFTRDIEIGTMIETPAAVLITNRLAREVQFFSIGTNDLIQYTIAVDRLNEKVAYLYQPTHPSIISLISHTVKSAHDANIWVGVCGEMSSELLLVPLLLGLGVDELSMGPNFLSRAKAAIQSLHYQDMQKLVAELQTLNTADEIMSRLEQVAEAHFAHLLD